VAPPTRGLPIERLAIEEGRTKSELFRAMVRLYRSQRGLMAREDAAVYEVDRSRVIAPLMGDLPDLMAALPHLGPEDAAAFAGELHAARAEAGEASDPWAL